ncbi:MAG: methyltransferase domain-containing protein [Alphaproteobacteria bacterium]|nr:methyltransferase domain-containing protein [Alphaproteobacteria bacterium]
MPDRNPLLLSRSSYYAPVPILAMDAEQSTVDFNIALRVLMDPDIEGARFQTVDLLMAKLRDRTEGDILPPLPWRLRGRAADAPGKSERDTKHSQIATGRCRYRSERFGWTDLRSTAVAFLDPAAGSAFGTTFYWEVLGVERNKEYWETLDWERRRQLIWESYAISYDRVLPILPFYQDVIARHVEAMRVPNIESVFDLGAGTGNVTVELLKNGHLVTALDLSRAMLEKLRHKTPEAYADNLTVVEQNAEELTQWDDNTFDGVSVLLAFYDMARPGRALSEAIRVLRPGGTIVITEPKRRFRLEPLLDEAERFLREKGVYDKLKADWDRVNVANKELDPAVREERLYAKEIEQYLREAGFENLRAKDSHLGNCATVWGTKSCRNRKSWAIGRLQRTSTRARDFL